MDALRGAARTAPGAPTGEDAVRPDEDDGEWAPGAGAAPEDAPATGSAIVLASVYDETEREANEEMARGLAPGTYARWRRESEERQAAREAERAARAAEASDEEWAPGETAVEETPKQKAARERRERAEYAKNRARWAREDARDAARAEREYARKDHRAYKAGAQAGDKVGLDPQVSASAKSSAKKLEGK